MLSRKSRWKEISVEAMAEKMTRSEGSCPSLAFMRPPSSEKISRPVAAH